MTLFTQVHRDLSQKVWGAWPPWKTGCRSWEVTCYDLKSTARRAPERTATGAQAGAVPVFTAAPATGEAAQRPPTDEGMSTVWPVCAAAKEGRTDPGYNVDEPRKRGTQQKRPDLQRPWGKGSLGPASGEAGAGGWTGSRRHVDSTLGRWAGTGRCEKAATTGFACGHDHLAAG